MVSTETVWVMLLETSLTSTSAYGAAILKLWDHPAEPYTIKTDIISLDLSTNFTVLKKMHYLCNQK